MSIKSNTNEIQEILNMTEVLPSEEEVYQQGYAAGQKTVVDLMYPVGSVYISVNETNPSTLFGGTWERLKDRFLLASGGAYQNGATGGEATHTLTVDEMPSHTHGGNSQTVAQGDGGNKSVLCRTIYGDVAAEATTLATGGGQAHNNMPPYLAVCIWKRTA